MINIYYKDEGEESFFSTGDSVSLYYIRFDGGLCIVSEKKAESEEFIIFAHPIEEIVEIIF